MIGREDVKDLMDLERDDVLTIYLDVDPTSETNRGFPPGWRSWLNDALGNLEVDGPRERVMLLRQLKEDAGKLLDGYRPEGKAHILFLAEDMERTFDLPVRVDNRVHFGRTDVSPFLWLMDEYEKYGILQIDHERATLRTAFLGRANDATELHLDLDTAEWGRKDLMPPASSGKDTLAGSHRDAFEDRVEEHRKRFYGDVVSMVEQWYRDTGLDRLVVGGDEQSAAALKGMLPDHLADSVIGTLPLPRHEEESAMLNRVRELAERYERARERELVHEVVGAAKAGGNGALGLDDVLGSLREGRAQIVLVTWPLDLTVHRCTECGYTVGQSVPKCPVCGEEVEAIPLAEVLPRQAAEAAAEIEMVYGKAAEKLAGEGGIAARLRY